jgi:choloylglycine hydrolase
MRSATLWTTAWDLSGSVFYFHTQHNRRVRRIDLNQLDFSGKTIRYIKMDENRQQDILDITPSVR